ncbi:MAG: metallophosphoesterase [Candidatus Anstonellaceae archaeon]
MKILALSDLHSDEETLDRLRAISAVRKFDAVLFCGDLTNRGPISYAEEVISLFPNSYAVFGNMDSKEVAERLEELGVSVHAKKVKLGEWNLVGLGGSNPTPFRTPNEFSEDKIEEILKGAEVDEFSIVLSHPPPHGVFDAVGSLHVGSTALRKMVAERKPIMVICGHIHEYEGKQVVDKTLVVKLAPAERLRAAEITITDSLSVEFVDL